MKLNRAALCLSLVVALIRAWTLCAQEATPRPSYAATRATVSPVIDGDLSDAVWQTAQEITGFTQRDPNEGKPATQQTRVKVAYDESAIYFAAVMEDSAAVTPLLARRDSDLNSGDYIRISIDSQHDRQNGAAFVANVSSCPQAGAASSWVVELHHPNGAQLSAVVLAHYAGGWRVYGSYP